MERIDLTGQRFGSLTVLCENPEAYRGKNGKRIRRWDCVCDCGKKVTLIQNSLTATKNGTRSCGCSRKGRGIKAIRYCVVCGSPFECPPSDKTVTCSKECSRVRKSQLRIGGVKSEEERKKISESSKGRDSPESRKLATEAAKASKLSGSFESNLFAKHWVLESPSGERFDVDNLSLFVNNHTEWFDNPTSAKKALSKAANMKFRPSEVKGRKFEKYKGWRVIDFYPKEPKDYLPKYVLLSPDGKTYKANSLRKFLMENKETFPNTSSAQSGFYQHGHYNGWRILYWRNP